MSGKTDTAERLICELAYAIGQASAFFDCGNPVKALSAISAGEKHMRECLAGRTMVDVGDWASTDTPLPFEDP